jgi:phosphopantetheinyl transferase
MFWRIGIFEGGAAGRRAALLRFCAESLGLALERTALAHDKLGAPLLLIDGVGGDWHVSSASRENIYLFGLARERIGVDVEICDGAPPAWAMLRADERAALEALPPPAAQSAQFLRYWTAKEAYLKALGVGLRREPSEFGVSFDAQGRAWVEGVEVSIWDEALAGRALVCASVSLPRTAAAPLP